MVFFLVFPPLTFQFGSCSRLNWLPVGFWSHVKHLHSDSDSVLIFDFFVLMSRTALNVAMPAPWTWEWQYDASVGLANFHTFDGVCARYIAEEAAALGRRPRVGNIDGLLSARCCCQTRLWLTDHKAKSLFAFVQRLIHFLCIAVSYLHIGAESSRGRATCCDCCR